MLKFIGKYSLLVRNAKPAKLRFTATLFPCMIENNLWMECYNIAMITILHQTNPMMIRVDTKSGHGAGKPTSKSIEEYTDLFCFLVKSLGIQYKKWPEDSTGLLSPLV